MKKKLLLFVAYLICFITYFPANAGEKIFATYFDIPINSPAGTEVTGRIHLERNKDVLTSPIPKGYKFEIIEQDEKELFRIETRYDLSNRIMGVLVVDKKKNTGSEPSSSILTIALKDGNKQIKKFKITVRIVKGTLWSLLYKRYTPGTIKNNRLYGRKTYSDKEVAEKILRDSNVILPIRQIIKEYSTLKMNTRILIQSNMTGLKLPVKSVDSVTLMPPQMCMVPKGLPKNAKNYAKLYIRQYWPIPFLSLSKERTLK